MADSTSDIKDAFFLLPQAGGRLTIYQGVTEFNFYRGEIIHADGSITSMPYSLRQRRLDVCMSIRIDTDTTGYFWTDFTPYKRTLEANDSLTQVAMPFRSAYVSVEAATARVRVFASNRPEAMIYDSSAVMVASPSAAGGKANTITYDSVTVGGTATLIVAANPKRKAVTIQNTSANDLYIGGDASVTTATGTKLKTDVIYIDNEYVGDWYGISAGANLDVRYKEFE